MPWETETGLLTNYNGRITKCEFAPDAASRNPTQTLMWLTFATDNAETPEYTERYSMGDGWQSLDGGVSVEHMEGKKGWHPRSNAGQFVEAVSKIVPERVLDQRGHYTRADAWVGLAFHMAPVKSTFRNQDGDKIETERNFPDKYLSDNWQPQLPLQDQPSRSEPNTSGTTAPTPAPSPTTTSASANANALDSIDNGTREQLTEVARNSEDVASFTRNVLGVDGVQKDADLMMALTGPDSARYYDQLREPAEETT